MSHDTMRVAVIPRIQSAKSPFAAGHIKSLDGLRGTAVLLVFLLHYWGGATSSVMPIRLFGKFVHFGWCGVCLFFVLSGFLISGILWDSFGDRRWWRKFYLRRSLRIFPLYYLALTIAVVAGLVSMARWPSQSSLSAINWSYAFYLQNVPGLTTGGLPTPFKLGHFWSLAVEEQFYLLWPFALCLVAPNLRRAAAVCASVWLCSLAFRALVLGAHLPLAWATDSLLSRSGELSAGAYLAFAVRDAATRDWVLAHAAQVVVAASLLLIAMFAWSGDLKGVHWSTLTIGLSGFSILFAALLASCLRAGPLARMFQFGPLCWLGKISYGVYVYHLLLFPVWEWIARICLPRADKNEHLALLAVVAAAGTLGVATASFYFYESTFLRLKDRFRSAPPAWSTSPRKV